MTGTKFTRPIRPLILIGTLTAVVTTVACSSKPKPTVVTSAQPVSFSLRPEAPKSVAFTAETVPTKAAAKPEQKDKPAALKAGVFKSRDFGVSFEYPWQYSRTGAKAVAADYALQPQSDGLDSQITLVRLDIPKGFYPGSDFDSGYFILSLNPDLNEKECKATLGKDSKPESVKLNEVEYNWVESASGGHGESSKVRNYVAFTNDTCYEIETGVRTRNDGMSREVDPDQVMRRLDSIVATTKIDTGEKSGPKQQLQADKTSNPEVGK